MKRLLSFLLVIVLILSAVALISCDNGDKTPDATTEAPVDPGTPAPGPGPGPGEDPDNPGTPVTPGTTGAPFEGDYSKPY